jgi:hypothetical protein
VIERASLGQRGNAAASRFTRASWTAMAFGMLLVGAWFRIAQLRSQMLVDDEWHAVRMLLRADYAGIATHFGLADHSIPLTLYYRWLHERAALDEWSMHLPLLLAGIGLLLLAPWLLRRSLAPATRGIWLGLLAISPTLVYFSRTARPYALVALLGFVAIVAFHHWRRQREGRQIWAVVYVVATVVAGWAHLISLAFTLWPFVHHGCGLLSGGSRRGRLRNPLPGWRDLLLLGFATAVPLALALLPPLRNDWAAMAGKAGTDSLTPGSLRLAVQMQFGIGDAWLLLPLLGLLAFGAWRLAWRNRDLVWLPLGAAVAGLLAICIARPAWIQHAPVLVRYAAPVLPFLLLYLAEGAAGVLERARGLAPALAFAALAGLFVAGPLPGWYREPTQFLGHAVFQFGYEPASNPYVTKLQLGPVPAFYRDLAARPPGSVTLIETPQRAHSNYMPQPWLQAIHRQNVKFALAGSVCGNGEWDEYPPAAGGERFRRMARLSDILDGARWGGDFLVLRLQPWTLPPAPEFPWPVAWPDMPACVAKVEARLGAPVYRDEQIVVFALL